MGEERSDALAIEDAQFHGAGRDRLEAVRVEAAIGAQNAEAGAEPLFGMWPAGEHGADQAFGVRPDFAGPAAEPIRRPLGVAPVGAGHMVGVRAVLAAHVTALMDADALAPMENLDGSRSRVPRPRVVARSLRGVTCFLLAASVLRPGVAIRRRQTACN